MDQKSMYTWTARRPPVLNRFIKASRLIVALIEGLRSGIRRDPIRFADIGARGGLSKSWQTLWKAGLVEPIFVEPEPEAAQKLSQAYPGVRVIQKALGDKNEARTLYVTRQPGCSSLLRPDISSSLPSVFTSMYEIVEQVEVSVVIAEDAFAAERVVPDVLKLDVQGMELEILRGFGPLLYEVCVVELEVSFTATYANQPLFSDVYPWMIENGFGLIQISTFGVAGTGNAVQANAIFGNRKMNDKRSRAIENIALRVFGESFPA
jgi:FkbM family methyltransferase